MPLALPLPAQLELQFFRTVRAFVLDAEAGISRKVKTLAGYLDFKGLAGIEGVGEAAQLGREILVGLLKIHGDRTGILGSCRRASGTSGPRPARFRSASGASRPPCRPARG